MSTIIGNTGAATVTNTTGVTDSGVVTSEGLAKAAQIAIAVLNTVAALEISQRQIKLARDYFNLAKEMRDFWNSTYRDCEVTHAGEACGAPLYTPQYDLTAGRYVASVRQQFRKGYDNLVRVAGRYCTGLTATTLKDIALAESMAVGDAVNMAYRYEEARKEAKDDVRWSRRDSVLALGRGIAKQAQSYAVLASDAYGNLGKQANAATEGAFQALGYMNNRASGSASLGAQRGARAQQQETWNNTRPEFTTGPQTFESPTFGSTPYEPSLFSSSTFNSPMADITALSQAEANNGSDAGASRADSYASGQQGLD